MERSKGLKIESKGSEPGAEQVQLLYNFCIQSSQEPVLHPCLCALSAPCCPRELSA